VWWVFGHAVTLLKGGTFRLSHKCGIIASLAFWQPVMRFGVRAKFIGVLGHFMCFWILFTFTLL